jgi:chemotaxis-related protein WspB
MLVLTFQIGNDRLALDVRRVREVVPRVRFERVAGSPEWLAGLFVYRGKVVPVLDLHRLLKAGECPPHLSSRIILVPLGLCSIAPRLSASGKIEEDDHLVGLLAAQVADVREVQVGGQTLPSFSAPGQPDLGLTMVDEGGILHLLDLDVLLPEALQRMVTHLPGDA